MLLVWIYYLRHSNWLTLLGWLAAWNLEVWDLQWEVGRLLDAGCPVFRDVRQYLETSGKRRVWGLAFLGVYFGFVWLTSVDVFGINSCRFHEREKMSFCRKLWIFSFFVIDTWFANFLCFLFLVVVFFSPVCFFFNLFFIILFIVLHRYELLQKQ